MDKFVSFRTPEGGQIVVNVRHVVLFEPVRAEGQAVCSLRFAGIEAPRLVVGTLRDVGLRLQPAASGGALGLMGGSRH